MKCKNCGKELSGRKRKYCDIQCQAKLKYKENKEVYLARTKKWNEKNSERRKVLAKKACDKFRIEKREHFNELIMKSYHKNKNKWNSRSVIYDVLKCKRKPSGIIKACKNCESTEKLGLKYEFYPTKAAEVREAIKAGKIYYLCKECRK